MPRRHYAKDRGGAGSEHLGSSGGSSSGGGSNGGLENSINTPFDLAKRLRAAVQARDMRCMQRLFKRPEAAEMDDRSVAFVVRTAVEQRDAAAMDLLFAQPAVAALGARAVAGLLQTAIRCRNVAAVLRLAALEGAQHINTAYLSYLLEEATGLGHAGAIQSLSALQGHQTELEQLVPAGSLEGALRTAVLQGRRQMVYHMTESEGVQGMDGASMCGILGTAIYHRSGVITRYLCWAEAAQALPPASVAGLLQAALQVGDAQGLAHVCDQLPGARNLDAEAVTALLLAALQQPDCTMFCRLALLPDAQALGPGRAARLLEAALSPEVPPGAVAGMVCAVCELLPGARRIKPVNLLPLLRGVLGRHWRGAGGRVGREEAAAVVAHLCALPGAQALGSAECMELVRLAAAEGGARTARGGGAGDQEEEQEGAEDEARSAGSRASSPSGRSTTPPRGRSASAASSSSASSSGGSSPVVTRRCGRRRRNSRAGAGGGSSSGSSCSSRSSSPGSGSELLDVLVRQLSGAQQLKPGAVDRVLQLATA